MSRPYRISFVVREYQDDEGKTRKVWDRCGTAWINKDDEGEVKNVSIKFDFIPIPITEFVAFPPENGDREKKAPF